MTRNDVLTASDKRKVLVREEGKAKPATIGVLIDFKKAEISFYDAGTRAHMYTFSNVTVRSKLFPFMSTCEDTEEGSPPLVFNPVVSADWLKSKK